MRITNCGPKYFPDWLNGLLFGWFFNTSCTSHDINYGIGGNEWDRMRYDVWFLQDMVRDVSLLPYYHKIPALVLLPIYFLAVRLLGWFSFEYSK